MTARNPIVLIAGALVELPAGDTVNGAVGGGGGGGASYTRTLFTATAGQTVFLATYTSGFLDVYLNGVKLRTGVDFTATNGTTLTLAAGAALDDELESVAYGALSAQAFDGGNGTATVDFGAGANEASVAVTGLAQILATAAPHAFVVATDTSMDHTASDHRYLGLLASFSCSAPTAGVGFTVYASSSQKLTGQWTVRFTWQN